MTVLALHDRQRSQRLAPAEMIRFAAERCPQSLAWMARAEYEDARILEAVINNLGERIHLGSLDPTILGEVYEAAIVPAREDMRGTVYTPAALAQRLINAIPLEVLPPERRTVIDPSCGSGSLLIAAAERIRALAEGDIPIDLLHNHVTSMVHGIDEDRFATLIAELALTLASPTTQNGWNIATLDALSQQRQPYDIVVANPPWDYDNREVRQQYADKFVRWAMRHVRPGGFLGLILPQGWLATRTSAGVRDQLLDVCDIFERWTVPSGTFSSQLGADVIVAQAQGEEQHRVGGCAIRHVTTRHDLEHFLDGGPASTTLLGLPGREAYKWTAFAEFLEHQERRLDDVAFLAQGPQTIRRRELTTRDTGVPYLLRYGNVEAYRSIDHAALVLVDPLRDFQSSGRAQRLTDMPKLLVATASTSAWKWVGVDTQGGMTATNSLKLVAPRDRTDLEALLAILASGFGSAALFTLSGGTRNTSAGALARLPLPSVHSKRRLGDLGAELLTTETDADRFDILDQIDDAVIHAYEAPQEIEREIKQILRGATAPERRVRYAKDRFEEAHVAIWDDHGYTVDVTQAGVRVWLNSRNVDDPSPIPLPPLMPGWLVRPGATFRAANTEGSLDASRYRFHGRSYLFAVDQW